MTARNAPTLSWAGARYRPAIAGPWWFIGALIVLVARRPAGLFAAGLWAEDGVFYTAALESGWGSLVQAYEPAGYLPFAQRAMVLVSSWAGPYWMPVVANALALGTAALVAALIATRLPLDAPRRLALAAGFVLLPASSEIFGTLSHVQWVIAAGMIAYAFASPGPKLELLLLAVAALTGPFAILLLPLYVGRWWYDRWTWPRVAVLAIGAAIELAYAALTTRRPPVPPDVGLFPQVIVERVTHLPLIAGLLLIALVLIATWHVPARTRVALFGLALVIPVMGLLSAGDPTVEHLGSVAPRYYWLSTGLLGAALVVARHGVARTIGLAALAVVFVTQFGLATRPSTDWANASRCIGGPTPCTVPVEPQAGYNGRWDVRWLGPE